MKLYAWQFPDITVEVFGATGSLGLITMEDAYNGKFIGVKSNEPITKIEIYQDLSELGEREFNRYFDFGIDNIAFASCDSDDDGTSDAFDNCINTPNPNQADHDNDGMGDVCDDEIIDSAITQLTEQNYQSNERFAEAFILMRFNQGKGPLKIASELKLRGISSFNLSDFDWFKSAREIRKKKLYQVTPKKLKRFMIPGFFQKT